MLPLRLPAFGLTALVGMGIPTAWMLQPEPVVPEAVVYEIPEALPTSTPPPWHEVDVRVERGQNITSVLATQGIGAATARSVVEAAKEHSNLVKIRAGETLTFRKDAEGPLALVQPLDRWSEQLLVVHLRPSPHAEVEQRPVVRHPVAAAGEVDFTLWDTGLSMGLRPDNLIDLAKIFAWDVDFNTEVQRGDRFRLVIDEVRDARTGALVRYGDIRAAEFRRASGETTVAYRYVGADGAVGFFDAQGESSQKPFLKSPLEFSRVSSGFGRRFHPVLKRWRAHRGTDYAAGTGTPIRAIGEGVVSFVGTKGGYGRHVRIQHNDDYASSYSHLSAYGVKKGQRVHQGDVLGKVGSTGLATGPHLHFEFYRQGNQVDYGSMDFDRSEPLAPHEREDFAELLATLQPLLEGTLLPRGTCSPPLASR